MVLPVIFLPKGNESVYLLCHEDLNSANILVEPSTFKITGIINCEMICILIAFDYPKFLRDVDPMDDKEPPIPPIVRG